MQLTRFTSQNPNRLSKSFKQAATGELVKEPGGYRLRGEAELVELAGITDFGQLLTELSPRNALSYGVTPYPRAQVVQKKTEHHRPGRHPHYREDARRICMADWGRHSDA